MSRQQAVVESAAPTEAQARIWDAFRRWGYLQANLDPLGDLQPVELPELAVSGPAAGAARKSTAAQSASSSCTSPIPSGAAGSKSAWNRKPLQHRRQTKKQFSIVSSAPKFSSKFSRRAISARSAIHSKANPRSFRFSMQSSMPRESTTRSKPSWR